MLGAREFAWLKQHPRAFRMTAAETIARFETCGVPAEPSFVAFQQTYGGYQPHEDLRFGIVEPSGRPEPARVAQWDGELRVRCDVRSLVQIDYWLAGDGRLYYGDTCVAASFESYVRYHAYLQLQLDPLNWTFIDAERRQTKRFTRLIDSLHTEIVAEVSDPYHSVRRGEEAFWLEICGRQDLYVCPQRLQSK